MIMKRSILLTLLLAAAITISSRASAQWVTNDSANGLVYGGSGEPTRQRAEGPPDGIYMQFDSTSSSFLDMGFSRDTSKHRWLPILPKARLIIYGAKDPNVDSSALSLRFYDILPGGAQGANSGETIIRPGISVVIVPDTEYTYAEFTLTGAGTKKGSHGFHLDAITLFQNFTNLGVGQYIQPQVATLANYPNPFMAASPTNINVHLDRPGTALVIVSDAIGREVSRTSLGSVGAGDHTISFRASAPGVYYARLMLNGAFSGPMLKMSALR